MKTLNDIANIIFRHWFFTEEYSVDELMCDIALQYVGRGEI